MWRYVVQFMSVVEYQHKIIKCMWSFQRQSKSSQSQTCQIIQITQITQITWNHMKCIQITWNDSWLCQVSLSTTKHAICLMPQVRQAILRSCRNWASDMGVSWQNANAKNLQKKKCSFHKWKMMKAKNHAEKGFTVQKKHLKTCKSIAIGLTQVTCHVSCDSCVSGALNSNLMPSKRWLAMATSVCRPLPRPPSNSAWLRLKAPTLRRPSKPKHRAEQFFEGKTSKTYKVTSIHISYIESRQVSCRRSYLTTQIGCKESNEQRNNWNNHKLNRVLQEQKQQTWLASKRS